MATEWLLIPAAMLLSALVYFEKRTLPKRVLPTKTALSTLFLVVALLQPREMPIFFVFIVVGLVFCLGGDVLLALPQPGMFLMGLVAFLTGHLLFCVAFFHSTDLSLLTWIGGLSTLIISFTVYLWLKPHLGGMHMPVVFYIVVISIMLCGACSMLGMERLAWKGRLLAFTGALSFYLSDLFVARDRFLKPGFVNRLIGLPLYYAGQFMIAFSIGYLPV